MEEKGLGGVISFYTALSYEQQQAGLVLHEFLMSQTGVSCKIRYNTPFYDGKKMMCYTTLYKRRLELSFMEAKYLPDPHGMLEWRNRKAIASIPISTVEDTDWDAVETFVRAALLVDADIAAKKLQPSILWGKQR